MGKGCGIFVLWFIGGLIATSTHEVLGDVYMWATIIGGVWWWWDRGSEDRSRRAAAVADRQRRQIEEREFHARRQAAARESEEINNWRRSGTGQAITHRAVRTPDPVSMAVVNTTKPGTAGHTEARQAVVANVCELARLIGLEAADLTGRLAALPDYGCAPGRFRERVDYTTWSPPQEGERLTTQAADVVLEVFAWSTSRSRLLAGVHPVAAQRLSGPLAPLDARLRTLAEQYARFDLSDRIANRADSRAFLGDGCGPEPCLPSGEWPEFIRDLRRVLSKVRDDLATVAAPAPLPALSPPRFARLNVDIAAETVTQELDAFLWRTNGLLQAATAGPRPIDFDQHWALDGNLLRAFLTVDVRDRFLRATAGFSHVADWSEDDITRDTQSVFYLAYVEIAAAYLKEVLDLMPEYTKASGQGEQRDPVTIKGTFLGPVGNVGGTVTGSSVTVGEHVTVDNAAVTTTATVDSQVALKLIDLAAAIQTDPGVGAEERSDLLIDVQDIAHAEAAPEDRARFRKAKRALMAITAAASTAQQVEGVLLEGHDIFNKYR